MHINTTKFLPFIAVAFFIQTAAFTQDAAWYKSMPAKAVLTAGGSKMEIGKKTYPVYNAFDPIAPKGGERVVDYAGALDFYMWFFRIKARELVLAFIDMDLNIYYYDEHTQKYTSPGGRVFETQ